MELSAGEVIRIGSRKSRLAVMQAELIRAQIECAYPEIRTELVTMKTTGDKILDKSLETIGGKGLFVRELDQALLDGTIDLAVHSLKDLPMEENEELPIAAYSVREDPRDVLIFRTGMGAFPQNGILIQPQTGDPDETDVSGLQPAGNPWKCTDPSPETGGRGHGRNDPCGSRSEKTWDFTAGTVFFG